MANPVAPIIEVEPITTEQLGRLSDRLIAKCRKHAAELPKSASQQVLEDEGDELVKEMFESLRKRVERRAKLIVRHVTVNRDLTPMQLVDATGRKKYVNEDVLKTMPRQGTGTEDFDMYFFNEGRYLTIDEQEKILAKYGLEPDYYGQTQANIDDSAFADEHPNGAQWDNKDGQASYVTFSGWGAGRGVDCRRGGHGWLGVWWFAGRRPRK